MEQARYWMWTKRKHSMNSQTQALTDPRSYNDSWEEQAFAEDAAGPHGGCIWPPRSYSCSFCRREFRSAQALGGHMNVHRRDRARLKQSTSPHAHHEILHHHHQSNRNHIQNPCISLGVQCPSQACTTTLVYNPKPNSDYGVNLASPSSPSRVSAPPATQENYGETTLVVPPIVQGQYKRSPFYSPPSRSNLVAGRYFCISDSKTEGEKNSRILEPGCRAMGDYVNSDLSVSLNLVVRRTRPAVSGDKEEAISTHKKRRTDASPPLPFFLKPSSVDRHLVQSEVSELSPSSLEELDLELRLGDRPNMK